MRKDTNYVIYMILVVIVMSGCGETVRGMWKDTKRVGEGVKKVFVCDSARYGD